MRGRKEEESWRLIALEAAFQFDHIGPSFFHVLFPLSETYVCLSIFTNKAGVGRSLGTASHGDEGSWSSHQVQPM